MLAVYKYNGDNITFEIEGETYVNATEMAKPFGKRVNDFLNLKATTSYLEVLETTINNGSLIKTVEGRNGGTWMHESLAIEFAGWLSPAFKVWCNQKIKELLTTGQTSIKPPLSGDELILEAMTTLMTRVEEQKEQLTIAHKTIEKQRPKVDFVDRCFDNGKLIDIGQCAKILNIPGVGRNILFQKLRDKGILFKSGREPMQKYITEKWFVLREKAIQRSYGEQIVTKILVTQKGIFHIKALFDSGAQLNLIPSTPVR